MKHLSFYELKSVAHKLNQPKNRKLLSKEDRKFIAKMDLARTFTRSQKERITQINRDFQP